MLPGFVNNSNFAGAIFLKEGYSNKNTTPYNKVSNGSYKKCNKLASLTAKSISWYKTY